MFCNQCGHRNPAGANFCSSCGSVLERPSETEPSTLTLSRVEAGDPVTADVVVDISDLPRDARILVVKRGPNSGTRYRLGQGVTTVGRHPESDIFLDDVTVSRRHAELALGADGVCELSDTGSLNGTYINRERTEAGKLQHGDEIQIGKFRLVYFTEAEDS